MTNCCVPSTHPQNTNHIPAAATVRRFEHLHSAIGPDRLGLLHPAGDLCVCRHEFRCTSSAAARPAVDDGRGHIRLGRSVSARNTFADSNIVRADSGADHVPGRARSLHLLFGQHCGPVAESKQIDTHRGRPNCVAAAGGHSGHRCGTRLGGFFVSPRLKS